MFDDIWNLINDVRNRIEEKIKEISGLESDYEELLALKKGLNNILEAYQKSCDRDRTAMDDDVFESCRCMQMFRNGMLDVLNSTTTASHSGNVSAAVTAVSGKAQSILDSLGTKEAELSTLQQNLENYRAQVSAMQMSQEG